MRLPIETHRPDRSVHLELGRERSTMTPPDVLRTVRVCKVSEVSLRLPGAHGAFLQREGATPGDFGPGGVGEDRPGQLRRPVVGSFIGVEAVFAGLL